MPSGAELPSNTDDVLRVVIRHPMRTWADGLGRLLASCADIEVVTAQTAHSWVRHAVITQQVDVLLTHVSAPGDGMASELAELFETNARLGVVVITESRDETLLLSAVRAGVRGWVDPDTSLEHLVRVLRGVARGETWFPPALLSKVLSSLLQLREARDHGESALSVLSTRELEVLGCLVAGRSRQDIAERLCLSPHTVRTHINNLLRKLDVHSTLTAVSIARRAGLSE